MAKILVADDSDTFKALISKTLRNKFNSDFIFASDGKEAFEVTREERPALVLLDLTMPEMDGAQYLELLRADPELKATPVIVLSDVTKKEEVEKVLRLGIEDYVLKKNYNAESLYEKIRKIFYQNNVPM